MDSLLFKAGFEKKAAGNPLLFWKNLSKKDAKPPKVNLDAISASEDRGSWKNHPDLYSFSGG